MSCGFSDTKSAYGKIFSDITSPEKVFSNVISLYEKHAFMPKICALKLECLKILMPNEQTDFYRCNVDMVIILFSKLE